MDLIVDVVAVLCLSFCVGAFAGYVYYRFKE